jgi:hypothetical protein
MQDRPLDIRRFETLQLIAAFVGLVHGWASGQLGVLGPVFSTVLAITLTLLVSRYRKNWARWTLLTFFVLGVVVLFVGLFFGLTQKAFSVTYPALTAIAWLLSTVALGLLFTRESNAWLRSNYVKS